MQMGYIHSQDTTMEDVNVPRIRRIMDDSLPSQTLQFQTSRVIRVTLSQISDLAPDKLPFRRKKYLEVRQLFGVAVGRPNEICIGRD